MGQIELAKDLVEKARALQADLLERASDTETNRQISAETIRDFRQAGFFKILQPKEYGGYELPLEVLTDVIYEVGRACGSSAWVLAVLCLHQWEVASLPNDVKKEVWGDDPDVLLSSAYAPTGETIPVEGGFMLNGRWPFSSGCDHAQWAILGGALSPPAEGAPPTMCSFLLPRSDYTIEDNWYTMGMCGTGSKVIVVDRKFVPARHMHPIFASAPPPSMAVSSVYRMPFGLVFQAPLAAASMGMARGALDRFIERTKTRTGAYDKSSYAKDANFHRYIAETEFAISAARVLSHSNLVRIAAKASHGYPEVIDRARASWEISKGVHSCTEAVTRLFSIAGAHSTFAGNALQRSTRDLQCATTHPAFNFNVFSQNYGAMILGFPNSLLQI